MPTLESLLRTPLMADDTDGKPGTKTVRINGTAATQLQAVKALKDVMGEDFNSVDYLNGLVVGPIGELYEATVREFNEFQKRQKKGK